MTRRGAHGSGEDVKSENEEEEGEETKFLMTDGKEREGILEWVRRHRDAFGIAPAQRDAQATDGGNNGGGKGRRGHWCGRTRILILISR